MTLIDKHTLADEIRQAHDAEKIEAAKRWREFADMHPDERAAKERYHEYKVHLGRAQGLARAYALALGVEFAETWDNGHVTNDVWRLAEK